MTAGVPELRLEVQDDPTGLPNLIKNPSAELGAWGWITPVANTKMLALSDAISTWLGFTTTAAQLAYFQTELLPITPAWYAGARIDWIGQSGPAGLSYWRMRLEFYNAAGGLISSGAYSGYQNAATTATVYLASAQAPALTAYVRLRVQLSASNAADTNTVANRVVTFRRAMVTKAATAAAIGTARRNFVRNPSFEVATTGWSFGTDQGDAVTVTRRNDAAAGKIDAWYARGAIPAGTGWPPTGVNASLAGPTYGPKNLSGGRDTAVSAYVRVGGFTGSSTVRLWWQWKNAAGSVIASEPGTTIVGPAAFARISKVATAPSDAVAINLLIEAEQDAGIAPVGAFLDLDGVMVEQAAAVGTYFDGATADTASFDYAWSGTAHDSESTETSLGQSWPYVDPIVWRNILGPAISAQADRKALDAGTLTAVLRDAGLDPASSDAVRPGRHARLMVKYDANNYRPLVTCKLLRADATYDKRKTDSAGELITRISLAGADNAQVLANTPERRGVATLAELPYLLEGAGVPWNVNGSGDQVIAATTVSTNDQASLLDQISVTRDTVLGHAYVSAAGQLVTTAAPAASGVTFADAPIGFLPFNGTFDANVAGWSGVSGTIVDWIAVPPAPWSTGGALRMTRPDLAAGDVNRAESNAIPVVAGNTYTFQADGSGQGSGDLRIYWFNAADVEISNQILQGGFAGGKVHRSGTAVAPALATKVKIRWQGVGAAVGRVDYLDNVTVEDVTVMPSYTGIDVGFATDECINAVMVNWLRYNAGTGATEVVSYGPYEDADSIATWGYHSRTFTIHGAVENAGTIAAYANTILAANKTPARKVRQLVVRVNTLELVNAVLDAELTRTVTVRYAGSVYACRVLGVSHKLNSDAKRGAVWTATFTFDQTTTVAQPTVVPNAGSTILGGP